MTWLKILEFLINVLIVVGGIHIVCSLYHFIRHVYNENYYPEGDEGTRFIAGCFGVFLGMVAKAGVYSFFDIDYEPFAFINQIKGFIQRPIPKWFGPAAIALFILMAVIFTIKEFTKDIVKEESKEVKTEEKPQKENKYNLQEYIEKLEEIKIEDKTIINKIKKLISNLKKLDIVSTDLSNKNGEIFADKYLPTLLDILLNAKKVKVTNKEKQNIAKAISLLDDAVEKVIKKAEEPTLDDINATADALSSLLQLNFKEQSDFEKNKKST